MQLITYLIHYLIGYLIFLANLQALACKRGIFHDSAMSANVPSRIRPVVACLLLPLAAPLLLLPPLLFSQSHRGEPGPLNVHKEREGPLLASRVVTKAPDRLEKPLMGGWGSNGDDMVEVKVDHFCSLVGDKCVEVTGSRELKELQDTVSPSRCVQN